MSSETNRWDVEKVGKGWIVTFCGKRIFHDAPPFQTKEQAMRQAIANESIEYHRVQTGRDWYTMQDFGIAS